MDIEPNLNDYWRIILKRKWVVIGVASTTAIAAFVFTSVQVPLYQTEAMVKYAPPGSKVIGVDMQAYDQWMAIKTQVRLLNSGDMVAKVARRMGAKIPPGFRAKELEDSSLIVISASGPDPVAITDLVNVVVEVYSEIDIEQRSASTLRAVDDIGGRRKEIEASLRELEERHSAYIADHPTHGLKNSLAGTLVAYEQQLGDLLKKFTEEHPEVVAQKQKIRGVKNRLAQMPGEDLELIRLERDIKINETLFIDLSSQVEEKRVALAGIPAFVTVISRAEVPEVPYYPNKRMNHVLGPLFGVMLGLILVIMLESLDISISTIEDIEKVVGVSVLGVVPHLGVERRWAAIKATLLRKQRYPIDAFRSLLLFQQTARSPTIEIYHSIRSAIQSQQPDKESWVLTFTSTGVAEGKTLTAVNFCLAAAHAGLKTLLIGSDIRRPVVHRVFGLPKRPGLMEVLSGKEDWRNVLRGTVDFLMGEIDLDKLLDFAGIDKFKVMTSWTASSSDIINVFSSPAFPALIKELRSHFDLIIFDCPPVLLFVDGVMIGAQTDGVVMVYQAGKMARQALKRAKDQLASSQVNILGVVLNDMHSSDMGPGYAYYYGYGHYAKKEES